MDDQISYEVLPDKSLKFYGIPDGDTTVEVVLRPLTRKDRAMVRDISPDDEEGEEKLLASIITKWGDRDGITSLELLQDDKEEAVIILGQAFQRFFQKRYQFVKKP